MKHSIESPHANRVQRQRCRLATVSWLSVLVSMMTLEACGARTLGSDGKAESQFLQQCGVCTDGYECVGEVCSRACDAHPSTCEGLPGRARCTDGAGLGVAICDVSCETDSDCNAVGQEYTCNDGFCRLEQAGSSDDVGQAACTHEGITYPVGAQFACGDGCNTCSCTEQGVHHPLLACPDPTCQYDGQTYASGESWECVDACTTCSCVDGTVVQTDLECEAPSPGQACEYDGRTYADGERWRCTDGCNRCFCVDGDVRRTLILC